MSKIRIRPRATLPTLASYNSPADSAQSGASPEATPSVVITRAYVPTPIAWRKCVVKGSRPETKEGATLTRVSVKLSSYAVEERLYLFGGLSRDLHASLLYFKADGFGTRAQVDL